MSKKIINVFIGIALLVLVFYFFGFENILQVLSKVNLFYFFIAGGFFLISEVFAALKLKLVSPLKFSKVFFSHLGGMFLSQMTPGRAGYFYTSYSLAKKENTSISGKVGVVSLIMGLMMLSKVFLIILAIIYFSFLFEIPNYLLLSFMMPILIVLLVFFVLYSKKSRNILSKIPILNKFVKYLELMQNAVAEISFKKIIKIMVLDIFGWLFWGFQYYFLINSLGYTIPFVTCLMLQVIFSAILFIPISPNALGLGESGSALVFGLLGFEPMLGVAFLLLLRINMFLFDSPGMIDLKTIPIPKKLF